MPFQPNTNPDGTANPLAGKDDAILYGATDRRIRAACRSARLEYLTFDRFFNVAGQPFQATLHVKSGGGTIAAGTAALTVPAGWTVDAAKPIGPIATRRRVDGDVHRHAERGGGGAELQDLRARHDRRGDRLHGQRRPHRAGRRGPLPPLGQVGRVRPRGSTTLAPQARRLGRSAAAQSMGVGETITLPVDVHNWSTVEPERHRDADAAGRLHGRRDVEAVRAAGRGRATRRSTSSLTNTDTTLPGAAINETSNTTQQRTIGIATSFSAPAAYGEREPDDVARAGDDDPARRGAAPTMDGPRSDAASTPARRST